MPIKFGALAFSLILSLLSVAHADNSPSENRPAPAPVSPGPGFSFDQGKAFWDQCVQPQDYDLIGSWYLIGHADVSLHFARTKNFYFPKGFRNSDDTIPTLNFAWQKDPTSGEQTLGYSFLNQGSENGTQGPYTASLDNDQNSVFVSKYAYLGTGLAQTYYRFDCRFSPTSDDQMACAMTLKIDPSEAASISAEQSPYDNVLGGIEIFKRAP